MKGATLNQLATFHTIATEGSITAAARKLEIAPASVSQSLKTLEQHLGLPLFSRTTRRIELTEAGRLLFQKSANAMTDIENALENVGDLTDIPSGTIKLTTPRIAYQLILEPIYAEFCQRFPEIQLEISVSDKSINIIEEGFDLGIRFGDRIEEGMIARALTKPMKDALFVSPDYAKSHGIPKTIEELKHHSLVHYRFIASNQLAPLTLVNNGEELTVDMPVALVSNDTDIMIDGAIKGVGIGRLIEPMVAAHFANQSLLPILKKHWYEIPGFYLYYHQHSQLAKRIRVFIDFLLDRVVAR